jgi:iron(III) transport system permease protein
MVNSGQYNVFAVDIYKQVIGQLNFDIDAVVGMAWLIPAVIALLVHRLMQKKQVASLSAHAVPLISSSNCRFDRIMLIFCSLIGLFLLSILLICKFAALAKFYPYELSLGLKHYQFDLMDGGGFEAYGTTRLALYTAII